MFVTVGTWECSIGKSKQRKVRILRWLVPEATLQQRLEKTAAAAVKIYADPANSWVNKRWVNDIVLAWTMVQAKTFHSVRRSSDIQKARSNALNGYHRSHPITCPTIRHTPDPSSDAPEANSKPVHYPSLKNPAPTLFLNCLSRCPACNSNRLTA